MSHIRARSDGKIYDIDPGQTNLATGDSVIFESDQCQEIAKVISLEEAKSFSADNASINDGKAVLIRRVTDKDEEDDKKLKDAAKSQVEKCKEIVLKHSLPMEILDADQSLDGKKLTFYFSAPGRVDFRSLVSELASTFQKLIRLQQVGARDRARFAGGTGRCGEQFCCKRFLQGELEGVTVDMAYDQGIGQMGSNRITGACGKLMCCLRYELDFYKKAKTKLPAVGSKIKTPKGEGIVVSQSVLKNKVTVELDGRVYLEVDC